MTALMVFLHILGTACAGFYLVLPFLAARLRHLSTPAQEGLAEGMVVAGRYAQYALILLLLTGGYRLTLGDYALSWKITVIVLLVLIGAASGMIQKPLKRIAEAARRQENASDSIDRVQKLGYVALVLFAAMLWIMADPWMASA
ncbi:MAG TPA: hypothetical protein VIL22_01190 [Paenibacillaceae bacterium]